jgi:hypothetical protein
MQLFQSGPSTPPAPPTPLQQLDAQVNADLDRIPALSIAINDFFGSVGGNIYASKISNGTPDETFAPQDYFAAVDRSGKLTSLQLCAISALTLQWRAAILAVVTPKNPDGSPGTSPPAPQIPPDGITLAPNGTAMVVSGVTALQAAQANVIAARAELRTVADKLASDQVALATAITASKAGGATAELVKAATDLQDAVAADKVLVADKTAALATAQSALALAK